MSESAVGWVGVRSSPERIMRLGAHYSTGSQEAMGYHASESSGIVIYIRQAHTDYLRLGLVSAVIATSMSLRAAEGCASKVWLKGRQTQMAEFQRHRGPAKGLRTADADQGGW
ncbi:hypothetical protein Tco_0910433 [Tanacetum coccineum]|uniref:Uncharacterized protein n=1 Tax=Tanacetum coccineum TaxID=301880 RepID=A0ABQ5CT75_9ASTR